MGAGIRGPSTHDPASRRAACPAAHSGDEPVEKTWRTANIMAAALGIGLAPVGTAAAEDRSPEGSFVTEYGFDPDLVQGDTVHPNGSRLTARTRGARESLVRARLDFVEALCRSVEAL
jgi:hypothetical protein